MILVTGSTGLIGKELVSLLKGRHAIHILDLRSDYNFDQLESSHPGEKNILVHLAWESLPSAGSSLHNIAARADVARSVQLIRRFANSTLRGKAIVFLSSSGSIYASYNPDASIKESSAIIPNSDYARAKLYVEHELGKYDIPSISLRCANAWGGRIHQGRRNGLIDKAIHNTFLGHTTVLSVNPGSIISVVHVYDICKAIDLSIDFLGATNNREFGAKKYVLNLSSESKSIQEITTLISTTLGTVFVNPDNRIYKPTFTTVSSEQIKKILSWKESIYLNECSVMDCYNKYLDIKGYL
jgi:nucleoside-diphosphate-sugar epimerase